LGIASGMKRVRLADGSETTVHVVAFAPADVRVVRLAPEEPVPEWCARVGVRDALSGGFSTKPEYGPLGQLWLDGAEQPHTPFAAPWGARRAALLVDADGARIDRRDALPETPAGDLVQAGPLLVRDGASALEGVEDPEGFSASCEEFDEDLTASRLPRLALATTADGLLAVAADGRAPHDAGLTFWELADLLVELGAENAMNLDGGSAGVIMRDGERVNVPRSNEGEDMETSSPSTTAIVFSA
jgi:hypothetical protein